MVTLLALTLALPLPSPAFDRQASVSSDGRVASTTSGGTYIAGKGRVAEGGNAVAWSPDGQTLAISIRRRTLREDGAPYDRDDVVFWPSGPHLDHPYGLQRPLAWSPNGDRITGSQAGVTGVFSMPDGKAVRSTGPRPSLLRWTSDGRLLAISGSAIYLDDKPVVQREKTVLIDAVPTPTGIVWLESDAPRVVAAGESPKLSDKSPIRIGQWNAADGAVSIVDKGAFGTLLSPSSDRRLSYPTVYELAPDGLHGAVAGVVLEGGARSIARLRVLMAKASPTPVESAEFARLLRTLRKKCVVTRADAAGGRDSLWSSLMTTMDEGVTDLAWSPDGKWLAIARKDGTVRVAAGS